MARRRTGVAALRRTGVGALQRSGPAATEMWPGMARITNMGVWPGGSGMPTSGGWSDGSGYPEWWPAVVAAALGPNYPGAASVFPIPSMTSGGVPIQASTAHRGGGRRSATVVVDKAAPGQAVSSGRKRKRGTGPPIPPQSSEILDLTIDPADASDARFFSSGHEMDVSESDEDCRLKRLAMMRSTQNNLFGTALIIGRYYMTYCDKNEPIIPEQSGHGWMLEVLKRPGGSHKIFRMNVGLFYRLHDLLVSKYGLNSSIHMSSMEALAMFLAILGHGWSNSAVQHNFKHSSETISRKFGEVLEVVVAMCKDYIRPIDPNFSTTHSRITSDHRMMPFFKDCIGAIDGTHITAVPHPKDFIRYIGRSGKATQNVMAVVDFDLRFTYASIGQPGSMHDTNVLFHSLKDKDFPHPPLGKYYHVDAGYPNRPGYLAPYKGERYHVPDWRRGVPPRGEQEHFNHLHSSIRNAVERTFGVWKIKWRILIKMPSFSMDKQMMIVAATMCLHNYIHENHAQDKHFRKCDRNVDYVPTIPERYARHLPPANASDTSTAQANDRSMNKFRDDTATAIFLSRSS